MKKATTFDDLHEHPPAPFNPDYDSQAATKYAQVVAGLEDDGWYANHTREECKAEWRRRYESLTEEKSHE